MARYNANRYQYETSPRKLQPEYTPIKKKYPKKSTASKKAMAAQKQTKVAEAKNIKIMLYIGMIFAILFAVSYRNALVAQRYNELKNLRAVLESSISTPVYIQGSPCVNNLLSASSSASPLKFIFIG